MSNTVRPEDLKFVNVESGEGEYSLEVHLTDSAQVRLANERD